MEPKLREFLLARGAITESSLDEMISEKIDMEVIVNMTYDQLEKYIPKTGDQIAVINFCRRHHLVTPSCSTKTLSLIEKLKRGNEISLSSKDQEAPPATRKLKLGRPLKENRKINLGWIMNGKHVREIRGGGSRSITVRKDATKQEILKNALDLFFPKGLSTFGKLDKFTYDLLDFKEHAIDEELSVESIYRITKLNTLRFYLATNSLQTSQENKILSECSSNDHYNPIDKAKTHAHNDVIQPSKSTEEAIEEDNLNEFLTFPPISFSQYNLENQQFQQSCDFLELLPSRTSEREGDTNVLEVEDINFIFENETISRGMEISLEGILQSLKSKINNETICQFNIYREDIFNCCIRAVRRKKFAMFNKISVKFSDLEGTSEGAVDQGGPTREMFRLVIDHIKNSRLFFGDKKKYITLDGEALKNEEYFEAGRLISLSLIHGGPGPHFFSNNLFRLIVSGFSQEYIAVNNIDYEIQEKLLKVNSFADLESLQKYVEEEPIFSIAGWPILRKEEEKDAMVADVVKFYAYDRIRPALKQLKDGLKEGGVLPIIKENWKLFEKIMCDDKVPITSQALENLYTIVYSDINSSNRKLENRSITFWRELLLSCDDGECDISLEDILVFSTGADCVPPLGFEVKPRITFQKDTLYPTANTCGLELRLPIVHQNFEDFKSHFTFGIGNCKDFAFA